MKPMLAYNKPVDLAKLRYPLYSSPKLDGIRCIILNGVPVSRNLKPIPNLHVRKLLSQPSLEGFDGELMVSGDFNSVQSAIMSVHGEPDFSYHVFDVVNYPANFLARQSRLMERYDHLSEELQKITRVVQQTLVKDAEQINYLDSCYLSSGHEGSILRDQLASYKFGRSTLNEQGMIKLVQWHRAEAIVIGAEELQHNENEAELNELGYTKRSSRLEGQVGGDVLGALVCELLVTNGSSQARVQFKIGTGFTAEQRHNLWQNSLVGKIVTFKYKELSKYGVPRHPVFVGFRAPGDMS